MDAQIWWVLTGHYTAPGSHSPLVLSSFIFFLFAPLLYLVQVTHLLDSLPDEEESLILTGIRTAVNQHMLSQHALLSSLTPTLWKWIGIFCIPHWTTTFLSYKLSGSM